MSFIINGNHRFFSYDDIIEHLKNAKENTVKDIEITDISLTKRPLKEVLTLLKSQLESIKRMDFERTNLNGDDFKEIIIFLKTSHVQLDELQLYCNDIKDEGVIVLYYEFKHIQVKKIGLGLNRITNRGMDDMINAFYLRPEEGYVETIDVQYNLFDDTILEELNDDHLISRIKRNPFEGLNHGNNFSYNRCLLFNKYNNNEEE